MDKTSVEDNLYVRWCTIFQRLGVHAGDVRAAFRTLAHAYSGPGRHYHTLDHLATLLRLSEEHGADLAERNAIELAIFYHDAVYVPTRSDNELESAKVARQDLGALPMSPNLVARVAELVIATQHGAEAPVPASDADLLLFLDLDLSILGADRTAYVRYAEAIRREYAVYADDVYRPGRSRVLAQFLSRSRIYRTDQLHALWDRAARDNLAWELTQLR